ncbi:MAG: sigma-70 family RNA polymerase sigma factor [Hyphomicrobiaceae bacterium]|nr:sigma-70 family RNA polymerase sigma factor [Hyphomicrobiaceae bacterium]
MSENPRDPALLLALVATGDREAFRTLYAGTSAKLYGVILRISRRREVADEVMQEAYVKIWQHAADFDPAKASAIAWMAAIARNRALDEVRRKAPPVAADDEDAVARIADPAPLASQVIEAAETGRRLTDCLAGLEAGRGEIVRLAYLEGLSREELSARFGAPVATIKTWLHRSLKQLKDCLSG